MKTISLAEKAVEVLTTADGREKTALSRAHAAAWRAARDAGAPLEVGTASPPDMPARPERPALLSPRDVPKRKPGSPEGRIADRILSYADGQSADLIVMGAYEHSKNSHDIIGGATTDVLVKSRVPVMMAH